MFSVCPRGGEGLPQGTYPPPRYLPPAQVRTEGGVPQGTYPPPPVQARMEGGGTPRYLPPHPGQDRGGGTPRSLPPPPQPRYLPAPLGSTAYGVHDLLRSYASCVHAGGLSCFTEKSVWWALPLWYKRTPVDSDHVSSQWLHFPYVTVVEGVASHCHCWNFITFAIILPGIVYSWLVFSTHSTYVNDLLGVICLLHYKYQYLLCLAEFFTSCVDWNIEVCIHLCI